MKRRFSSLILSTAAILGGIALTGCGPAATDSTPAVETAIKAAEKMTEEQLSAKAKEEIGDGKLIIRSQTSGCAKLAAAFKTKYGIDYDSTAVAGSYKDYQLYTALDVVTSGEYYADMVMIQDIRSLKQYMSDKILYSYQPGDISGIAEEDSNPMAGLYFNKLFMYNLAEKSAINFHNVWQLAGKSTDSGHISKSSFQSPTGENINMNFLLSMTSPSGITLLKSAYKDFYGSDYVDSADYVNIGYKYIKEYIANISTFHTSDTTAVKATLPADTDNTVFYCAFAKYKDMIKAMKTAGGLTDEAAATKAAATLGWQDEIKGFKGFLYKMYPMIPATVKYPYATALFVRYMMTEEGFKAGWGNEYGYYSANPANPIMTGDKTIAYWKSCCLVEDGTYLPTVKNSLISFVNSCVTSHA